MKILVLSDSHGREMNMYDAVYREKPDMIIHCGDGEGCEDELKDFAECPVEIVKGNNDFGSNLPDFRVITVEGHTIFVAHGHRFHSMRLEYELAQTAKQKGAELALFGHIHVPVLREVDGVMVANPGSISLPRQTGHNPTYLVLDVKANQPIHYTQYEMDD